MNPMPSEFLRLHCRRLFLRRHEVMAQIGVHDFEKGAAQRVFIDVSLYVPYAHSTPRQDRLAEVVDYDYVREVVRELVSSRRFELQETLCDALAERLLAHPQVAAVEVSTAKPDVYPDCAEVGVQVFRAKDAPPSSA